MQLNLVEKALMNNPIRSSIQRWYEVPLLIRMGGKVDGLQVLEVGCGRGQGAKYLLEKFVANKVHAFDLDPKMIDLAQKRLKSYPPETLKLSVGSVTEIQEPDESFDAVFDFGVIHHVVEWKKAISEITRVLKPNGRFFFEEVTRHALERKFYRTFLRHPNENRFSGEEFIAELEQQKIMVGNNFVHRFFGDFIIGVGKKRHMNNGQTSGGTSNSTK